MYGEEIFYQRFFRILTFSNFIIKNFFLRKVPECALCETVQKLQNINLLPHAFSPMLLNPFKEANIAGLIATAI